LLLALCCLASPSQAEWNTVVTGLDNTVRALAFDARDNLYLGGYFNRAGGASVNRLAEWTRTNWAAPWRTLNSGADNLVQALAVEPASGVLYAGGWFTQPGAYLAAWDGNAWSSPGGGMNGPVYALAVDGAGRLYAGGNFSVAGDSAARHVAWWDGATWHPLGGGLDGPVSVLAFDGNGRLYAGGGFLRDGNDRTQLNYIAYWDGAEWKALGNGTTGGVHALALDQAGNLYAGGQFAGVPGLRTNNIARWDGAKWYALGSGMDGPVHDLLFTERGRLYAAGAFLTAGGVTVNHLGEWDGSAWRGVDGGTDGPLHALAQDSAGRLFVAGEFSRAGAIASNRLAYWVYRPVADIRVWQDNAEISDDSGSLDFGEISQDQAARRELLVENHGQAALSLEPPSLPPGFSLAEFPRSIPAGETARLTLELSTQLAGVYSGEISFATNVADRNPFNFTVRGTVLPVYNLLCQPQGNGRVDSEPAGAIQASGECRQAYAEGSLVRLSASPGEGAYFAGWQNDCSGGEPVITVLMDRDKQCTPVFADQAATPPPATASLRVSVSGAGGVSGEGIDCGKLCLGEYPLGTSVLLKAIPAPGFVFAAWNDPACGGLLELNADIECAARFVAEPPPACSPNTYQFALDSGQNTPGAACIKGSMDSGDGVTDSPPSVAESARLSLNGRIRPSAADIGQPAEIVLAVRYLAPGQPARWLARDGQSWRPWNTQAASLPAAARLPALPESLDTQIFTGSLRGLPGSFSVYIGYRRGNRLIYGSPPLQVTVTSENP
jgi:hypothetical protein